MRGRGERRVGQGEELGMDPTGLGVQLKPDSTEDSELELHCKLGPILKQGHWPLVPLCPSVRGCGLSGRSRGEGAGYFLAWGFGLPFW